MTAADPLGLPDGVLDAAVETAATVLNAEGAAPDDSIHSWRCKYPDQYGDCDCIEYISKAVLLAVLPGVIAAAKTEGAKQVLAEACDAADGPNLPHGTGDWFDGACDTIAFFRNYRKPDEWDTPAERT